MNKKHYWHIVGVLLVAGGFVGLLIGATVHQNKLQQEPGTVEEVCKDSSQLRPMSDEVRCHPQAALTVHWGGAIPSGSALYTCHCKR